MKIAEEWGLINLPNKLDEIFKLAVLTLFYSGPLCATKQRHSIEISFSRLQIWKLGIGVADIHTISL